MMTLATISIQIVVFDNDMINITLGIMGGWLLLVIASYVRKMLPI